MAESTSAAAPAASIPTPERIAQAERFTREPFLHAGEDAATALATGTARRRALDRALDDIDAGLKVPSTKWRRRYSMMLGLERVLSEDEPRLADGTLLNPHQVDALSGTLTALLTREQGNGHAVVAGSAAPVLAVDETAAYAPPTESPAARPKDDAAPEDDEEDDDVEDDDEPDLELGDDDAHVSRAAPEEEDEDEEDDEPATPAASEEEEHEAADDESDSYEDDDPSPDLDEDLDEGAADDPNAGKRFWFEHATGAGKTVAAMGFVDASRTGGILILTHRRNLVDQFNDELTTRGYGKRISGPLLGSETNDRADGPVTVETYQWFVRNAGRISPAYTVVICDEAHTALGEKTSQAIREWTGPIFIGMTATGALIARHVADLFPTQTSRFDLAQAARRGVIAPLRGIRIPPGPGVRTIAKVPLRRGDVDVEFDQEMLAELLDQLPFNMAIANLYKTRFSGVPGVIYAAGVRHAYNVAEAMREEGIKAQAVSGETPKRELASILAAYERGDIDVLVNAQLLAEGWNSPRATVCMHLAPTASKRIYQQRVGRVTRRHPGKEAGVVVDFVHPATKNDDPVVTLHSLLDRDVYRGGAIVVGPVRRGRGRRVRVERRVVPVCAEEERRHEVFERELWRIAVEFLDWGEQHMWAALAGARVAPSGWRRARAMLHFDRSGELKRRFLLTAVERNRNPQLRVRALQEIAAAKDPDAFEASVDIVGTWPRDERREAVKVLLQALAEKRIGRRDQANQWIWDLADMTREVHEEYAVQRWPETKRLLGLLVNSSGGAHARNARRLVHASRKQDRRLSAALLAAAVAHTPEAMEVIRGARTRMARKPSSLSRELLRNFPKGRRGRGRSRRRKGGEADEPVAATTSVESHVEQAVPAAPAPDAVAAINGAAAALAAAQGEPSQGRSRRARQRRNRRAAAEQRAAAEAQARGEEIPAEDAAPGETEAVAARPATNGVARETEAALVAPPDAAPDGGLSLDAMPAPIAEGVRSGRIRAVRISDDPEPVEVDRPKRVRIKKAPPEPGAPAPSARAKSSGSRSRRSRNRKGAGAATDAPDAPLEAAATRSADGAAAAPAAAAAENGAPPKPRASRARKGAAAAEDDAATPKPRAQKAAADERGAAPAETSTADGPGAAPKPRASRARKTAAEEDGAAPKPRASRAKKTAAAEENGASPKPRASRAKKTAAAEENGASPKPRASRAKKTAAAEENGASPKPRASRAKTAAAEENGAAPKPRRSRATAKPSAAASDDA